MNPASGAVQEPHGILNTGNTKLKPVGHDRHGALYSKADVVQIVLHEVMQGDAYFMRKRKKVNTQIKEAVNSVDAETKMFIHAIDSLQEKEQVLSDATKKVSGSVRKAANELGEGLLKVEKMADFNKLERYVVLLERAAIAFESLAELEKTGKLEKIALAIK